MELREGPRAQLGMVPGAEPATEPATDSGTKSGVQAGKARRALARAESGMSLSVREVADLLASRGADLERLMELASRLRELGHGDRVTYSRKVFVPLTMLCRDRCHYCT